ncbi:MAG TPA: Gfo/Idh/MocA family oxidoreductase [Longimicrobiales bacterium]|nr:Gfo/Idh/MocA family oxidoreductase [Longimicrobiales bacterium]
MTGGELRIAVIGTGAIAQIIHLPVLSNLPGARVVAVCDRDYSKAKAIAARMDIKRVFQEDEEVFASGEVDAVIICSPSHLHERQSVAALEGGKHVLVERPLAMDSGGAESVIRTAEKAGRVLMVALNNRYRPDALGVKGFAANGELGDIFSIKGAWYNRKVRPKRLTWRHQRRTAGGGAFMDLGVQVLDLCLWMVDYPQVDRVCAHVHPGENMEVEDAASVLLRLANGGTVSVEVTWSLFGERDLHAVRVLGTAGSASLQPLKVYKEVEHALLDFTPQIPQGRENAYTASYREQLRQFVAAATGGTHQPAPREQVQLMRIVSAVYESAEKGREVRL